MLVYFKSSWKMNITIIDVWIDLKSLRIKYLKLVTCWRYLIQTCRDLKDNITVSFAVTLLLYDANYFAIVDSGNMGMSSTLIKIKHIYPWPIPWTTVISPGAFHRKLFWRNTYSQASRILSYEALKLLKWKKEKQTNLCLCTELLYHFLMTEMNWI